MDREEKHNTFVDTREQKANEIKGMSEHELIKMKFDKLTGKSSKERGGGLKRKNIFNLAVCFDILFYIAFIINNEIN